MKSGNEGWGKRYQKIKTKASRIDEGRGMYRRYAIELREVEKENKADRIMGDSGKGEEFSYFKHKHKRASSVIS